RHRPMRCQRPPSAGAPPNRAPVARLRSVPQLTSGSYPTSIAQPIGTRNGSPGGCPQRFPASHPQNCPLDGIPGGNAGFGKCCAKMASVLQVILGAPEATMNKGEYRMSPLAARQPHLSEL